MFLSVVIPAYNEERRIGATLLDVAQYLERQPYSSETLVVDDGSLDGTAGVVEQCAREHPHVRLLRAPHRGKGHAVKTGMLAATGEHRFLCDADLSMPIQELGKFLPPRLTDYDIAIGSREASGARRIGEPLSRHLAGRVFNLFVRMAAVPGIQDTQCGFKCFRAEAAQSLFPLQRLPGFAFDVEVLFLARRAGLRVVEVPIEWRYRAESKVSPLRHALGMARDVLRVRWSAWRGAYGRPAATSGGKRESSSRQERDV
ncbi:MAG: glycosyltransferase family 2 protein [Dehalococcoidia bacterium]|nr:glycosyltransferase family 2 protein [Dehalococcoidia bacterium]